MKKIFNYKIITGAFAIILGVALSIGLSYASYTVNKNGYRAPTGVATNGNTDFPVNISSSDQVKGTALLGGLGVREFIAAQNAQFSGKTSIGGLMLGLASTDPTTPNVSSLAIGDTSSKVHLTVQGKEYTYSHGLYSDQIKTGAGQVKTICSDEQGNIIICPPVSTPPPVIPPKDIYGSLTEWCDAGMPRVKFDFYSPTTVPFNMDLAMCTNTWWYASKVSCWGTDLLQSTGANYYPWTAPDGHIDDQLSSRPGSFNFTIPVGSTTWVTPDLQVNGEKAWCRGSGAKMEAVSTGFYNNQNPYPSPPHGAFVLKMLNNTEFDLHLTGRTQYKTDPLYNMFTPIIIK